MPSQIAVEPGGRGVLVSLSGTVRGSDIFALNEQLMADASFLQWHYQIWDFSAVEDTEVTVDQLREFAIQDSIAASKNSHQRIAIIPRMSSYSGLDRVFHIMEEVWGGYESRTFPTVDGAREWAGGLKD